MSDTLPEKPTTHQLQTDETLGQEGDQQAVDSARKHTDDGLEESEQRFRAVWDSASDAMALSNADGTVFAANPAYYHLFGYAPDEVIGYNFSLIFPKDQQQWAQQQYVTIFQQEEIAPAFERMVQRADGSQRFVEARYNFISRGGKRTAMLSIIRDITERKQAEERIRASEERFRALLERSADAISLLDKEGRRQYSTPASMRIVGHEQSECVGQVTFDHIHPDDVAHVKCVFAEIMQCPGTSMPAQFRVRHKNGSWVWIEGTGTNLLQIPSVQAIVVNYRDITERKLTEEALLTSEERLRLALDAGNIGVWDWDIQHNALTWSERVYQLHGVSKETFAVSLENFLHLVHPEDKAYVQEAIEHALQEHTPFNINFRLDTPPAEIRWLTTSAKVIYDKTGRPIRMLGATSDITQQKELERQKDEFIGMASHELKTPITSLKGFTQLLKRQLEKQGLAEPVALLNKMEMQLTRLTKLVSDLLNVSKIQAGTLDYAKEPIDIDTLVYDIVDTMQQISTTHTLTIQGTSHKQVVGDSDRLGQVFNNLISNAVKYSPQANRVDISLSATQDTVTVSVRDYGIGIPEEHLHKIFDRFYRVSDVHDQAFPGLGMGLYISSEIVERHGGRLWVENAESKGTTFFVSLPVA
jgi:PAS domain S-box-containing protein